jgi:hypothetical protein
MTLTMRVLKALHIGWQTVLLLMTTGCGGNAVLPADKAVIEKLAVARGIHAIHFVAPSLGYEPPEATSPLPTMGLAHPKFIEKIGLENPSETLKGSFLALWKDKFPSLTISPNPEPFPYRDLRELRTKYLPDLFLEFATDRWLFGGSFTDGPFLHVQLEAHTYLTDSVTGKILWRGQCFASKDLADEHSGKRLTLKDLRELDWKPLKSAWKEAADVCAREMVTQF